VTRPRRDRSRPARLDRPHATLVSHPRGTPTGVPPLPDPDPRRRIRRPLPNCYDRAMIRAPFHDRRASATPTGSSS
jgi:hypothetical protein